MSDYTFTVSLGGLDTVVRMGDVVVPELRVTSGAFGTVQVAGGVPGPKGDDGASDSALVATHISSETPHPVYDDLPSLTLLFENGLV